MEKSENKFWVENFYIMCCEGYIFWKKWKVRLFMLNGESFGGFRKLGRYLGVVFFVIGSVFLDLGVFSWILFKDRCLIY